MKLKCTADDFVVEERATIRALRSGRFTLYRLIKQGIGTPEAIALIRQRWNLAARQVSYGGLKDRHARTTQYLSIAGGPNSALRESSFELVPVGFLDRPYSTQDFAGNRFRITIRDMTKGTAASVQKALESLGEVGLPNYFDNQRFGSVGDSGEFWAEAWLKADYERAAWLALAEPNPHDRGQRVEEKALLREHWTRWADAKGALPRSHVRSLVTYLVDHPDDFRGAIARLDRTARSLAFSAYQSHLWNLILAAWLERTIAREHLRWVRFDTARLPFPRQLAPLEAAAFGALRVPLPSARSPLPPGELGEVAQAVTSQRGLEWNALRVKHMKDLYLSKGDRAASFSPGDVVSEIGADELYPGRSKIQLAFDLGRGSYATIVVKFLQASAKLETGDAGDLA